MSACYGLRDYMCVSIPTTYVLRFYNNKYIKPVLMFALLLKR